jgi:PAS domain S-box-containing protein
MLHYVIRTRENVILDDAAASTLFSVDAYVQQRRPRSVLCFPLVKQAKLVGALYLENNLTPRAFTSDRIAVLELLASQAAISLENARLYRDLEQREAKIRRLVDANIIGIYLWELEGRIIEANDTFLRMVGYDREDLVSGRVRWTDLTPPEWRDRSARNVEALKMTGSLQPHEKELFRKDGSRVPVLLGSAAFDEQRDQGVAFVLDLTERKRGEEALRTAEADLARATRLTTMGELAASIAHEINQPLAALITHGGNCLRWLANDRPNLDKARQAAEHIVSDGHRAADIIRSVHALARKSGPEMMQLDINDAIRDVLVLMRSELRDRQVALETELSGGLQPIMGDRVQLQQVILNLIMNGIEAMSAVMRQPRVLRVRSQIDGPGDVLIAIEDSGPGLSPEIMDRLFDPFFTTKPSGLGMGLSICRSIVDAHGGRLWASPQSPQGAVFQFTLPTIATKAFLTEAAP